MPETILPRTLRGLGNALGLSGGGRIGPAGVQLELPAQPVVDVGPYAAYGSARLDNPAIFDGWVTLALEVAGGGAGTVATSTLTVGTAQIPPFRSGDIVWIYTVSQDVACSAALADYGTSGVDLTLLSSIGTGAGLRHVLHTANTQIGGALSANNLRQWVSAGGHGIYGSPIPAPEGSIITARLRQAAAAGTVNLLVNILARILPPGVRP